MGLGTLVLSIMYIVKGSRIFLVPRNWLVGVTVHCRLAECKNAAVGTIPSANHRTPSVPSAG